MVFTHRNSNPARPSTSGEVYPCPWAHARKALKTLKIGEILSVVGDHGPALRSIPRNFGDEGQAVLRAEETGEVEWEILVRRES